MQVKECDPNMEKGVLLSLSPPVSDSSGDQYNTALKSASAQVFVLDSCVCILYSFPVTD